MNFKRTALLVLPLALLCSCGQKPSKPQYLIKTINKRGETKETAALSNYTEYVYKEGVISEELYYEVVEGESTLKNHIFYTINTPTEYDFTNYIYEGENLSEIDHFIYRYNDKDDLTYELMEYKTKEEDPFKVNNEFKYAHTYDEKGNLTCTITDSNGQMFDKEEYTYDNLNRVTECIISFKNNSETAYTPFSKLTFSYVDDTKYLDVENYYRYLNNEFTFVNKVKHTYNSSMLPTLIQTFDSEDVVTNVEEYVYEGKKVTYTEKTMDAMFTMELQLVESVIYEYASEYSEGMNNPLTRTVISYFYGTPMDKEVYKYTYLSNGECSFCERERYKYVDQDWELATYESTEYIYGSI